MSIVKSHPKAPDVPKSDLIDHLRNRIRKVETAGRIDDGSRISSGCAAVDRLLPEGGYQRGTLVQWLTGGGHGADYLSLLLAKEACADGGALVVIDPQNQFYPPAAAAIGINLDNLIVLRTGGQPGAYSPASSNDLLWSIDQSLRCPAVAAVWGPLDQIDERWFRRFQLSAESSGSLGLFIQPTSQARQPSWAEVQWLVSQAPRNQLETPRSDVVANSNATDSNAGHWHSQQVRLHLTRCRGTQTGKTIHLSINTITGNVQLARRAHESHRSKSRRSSTNSAPGSTGPTGPPGFIPRSLSSIQSGASPVAISNDTDSLSVVSELAHSTTGRQRA